MPEQLLQETGGHIHLPSRLRIRQRLGHVSTSKIFKESFVPKIASYGGQDIPSDMFVASTCRHVVEFALENAMDPVELAQNMVPRVIKQLVEDPFRRTEATSTFQAAMNDETFLTSTFSI